jgi:hypothetical protein
MESGRILSVPGKITKLIAVPKVQLFQAGPAHDVVDSSLQAVVVRYVASLPQTDLPDLDIIVRNNLLSLLEDQCIRFLREEDQSLLSILDTPQLQADSFVLSGFVSLQVTMILQWHLQNYQPPIEEMIKTYGRLIYQPLIHQNN